MNTTLQHVITSDRTGRATRQIEAAMYTINCFNCQIIQLSYIEETGRTETDWNQRRVMILSTKALLHRRLTNSLNDWNRPYSPNCFNIPTYNRHPSTDTSTGQPTPYKRFTDDIKKADERT